MGAMRRDPPQSPRRSLPELGRMKSLFISPFRFYLIFLSVSFAFCSLGGRLVYLQVIKADDYRELSKGARRNFIEIKARRGDIVDSKGNLLATTRSVVEVGIDPQSVQSKDEDKFSELASLLGIPVAHIEIAAKKLTCLLYTSPSPRD